MKNKAEGGFSLVELLIVVVVIGTIAAIAVPHLQKAIRSAENSNMFATLRSVATTQAGFISTNSRYGRLNEVNNLMGSGVGTPSGNELVRGRFTISMTPDLPSDTELRTAYTITATRTTPEAGVTQVYVLTQSGLDTLNP